MLCGECKSEYVDYDVASKANACNDCGNTWDITSDETLVLGAAMSDEVIARSIGISQTSHALLISLVYDAENPVEDRPFESIVEAFRFAFALG